MSQPIVDWEEVFVNNFIDKRHRERSLFELRSKKKRYKFFGSMSLIPDYKIEIPKFPPEKEARTLITIIRKYGAKEICYIMSNKKFCSVEQGIYMYYYEYALEDVLIFTENIAVVQYESGGYRPLRFILYRGDRVKVEQSLSVAALAGLTSRSRTARRSLP